MLLANPTNETINRTFIVRQLCNTLSRHVLRLPTPLPAAWCGVVACVLAFISFVANWEYNSFLFSSRTAKATVLANVIRLLHVFAATVNLYFKTSNADGFVPVLAWDYWTDAVMDLALLLALMEEYGLYCRRKGEREVIEQVERLTKEWVEKHRREQDK
ncbi:hypothetical protein BJ508DRAFT_333298 [Ascobolus immersus RN42]|uniref:Uncharacterized protein n=1 Tax=Ascobolus immersus RN42 TaxID=1160509 RepID=A0A3N4HK33_ASCIM|nr:hypothetical protein BJ508DRAFT_333298 [Ascobolus immersus RN42]